MVRLLIVTTLWCDQIAITSRSGAGKNSEKVAAVQVCLSNGFHSTGYRWWYRFPFWCWNLRFRVLSNSRSWFWSLKMMVLYWFSFFYSGSVLFLSKKVPDLSGSIFCKKNIKISPRPLPGMNRSQLPSRILLSFRLRRPGSQFDSGLRSQLSEIR